MRPLTTAIFVVAAVSAIAFTEDSPKATIGEPSPNFAVVDSAGKTQTLSDYKGKFVVLEWTNKDCPFVKKHYGSGNMQATQKKAEEMGAVWFSIITSAPGKQGFMSAEDVNTYRKDNNVNSTATLLDSDGKVGKIYNARTTPQIAIIDPKGIVIYNGAIDDKPSPDPETLNGATNYALQALKEAMAGKSVSVPTSRPYGCSVKY